MTNQIVYEGSKLLYDPCPGDCWEDCSSLAIRDLNGEHHRCLSVKRGCWKLVLADSKFVVVHGGPNFGVVKFRQATFVTVGMVADRKDVQNLISRPPADDYFDIFVRQISNSEGEIADLNTTRDRPLLWFADNLWSSRVTLEVPNFLKVFFGRPLVETRSATYTGGPPQQWSSLRDKIAAAIRDECFRQGYVIPREESYKLADSPSFLANADTVTLEVDTRQPAYHLLPKLTFTDAGNGSIIGTCSHDGSGDGLPYTMNFVFNANERSGERIRRFIGLK